MDVVNRFKVVLEVRDDQETTEAEIKEHFETETDMKVLYIEKLDKLSNVVDKVQTPKNNLSILIDRFLN
jgi:hypothetical protein